MDLDEQENSHFVLFAAMKCMGTEFYLSFYGYNVLYGLHLIIQIRTSHIATERICL